MIYTELVNPDLRTKWVFAVRSLDFPTTEQLLCQGGDTRILLAGVPALNKYGCSPYPDPTLVSFSSSTASIISEASFSAADELRDTIMTAIEIDLAEDIYKSELNLIKRELLRLCELDNLNGLEVVFGASGTDLHLIAAQLTNVQNNETMLAIMPDASETGSGVAAALSSVHFSDCSALGVIVHEGESVRQTKAVNVVSVMMRFSDGSLRHSSDIDNEVEALVHQSILEGQHVLLILVDTSKTGLISPSPACAIKLKRLYSKNLDVLVDACQFRMSTSTLRAYLEHDFMVILTGSKFLTGPVFSGALLVPETVAIRLLVNPIASGLRTYSSRAEWPNNFEASKTLDNITNFGLLLRWSAALEEFRSFKLVPESQVEWFTKQFAKHIQDRLSQDGNFFQIPIRSLDRSPLTENKNWDTIPTIFTFIILRENEIGIKKPLSHQETLKIYQWLQLDVNDLNRPNTINLDHAIAPLRCQLGQPVFCGMHNGKAVSALRLSLSARLIVEATLNNCENAGDVIQRALSVLDNVLLMLKILPTISEYNV